ncbi:MAG: hypothetical protein JSV03_15265 [Planctomycetota bacterium]|nr:MAG: hypothetical protein JSV03_15265 [Planctomycetota bacterium]
MSGQIRAKPFANTTNLWSLARQHTNNLRFSTLFTAPNIRDHLAGPQGIENFNNLSIHAKLVTKILARPKVALTIPTGEVTISAKLGSAIVKPPPRSLVVLRFDRSNRGK